MPVTPLLKTSRGSPLPRGHDPSSWQARGLHDLSPGTCSGWWLSVVTGSPKLYFPRLLVASQPHLSFLVFSSCLLMLILPPGLPFPDIATFPSFVPFKP